MTQALRATALLAGALSFSLFIACGDKDDDTTDGGTSDGGTDGGGDGGTDKETDCSDGADNDGDGRTDCDDSDCRSASACQVLEPAMLLFDFSTGMYEGRQVDATYNGASLGAIFTILLVSEDWDGTYDNEDTFCAVSYDVLGADLDSSCTNCWAGASWSVDTSMLIGTAGDCDKLDEDDWGADVTETLSAISWGFGFGNLDGADADFKSAVDSAFGSYWTDPEYAYNKKVFVGHIKLDSSWYNMNWAIAFEMDSSFDVGTGETHVEVAADEAFAPDGYYRAGALFGFVQE